MAKMQTFTIYVLIIISFFILSNFLEGQLIEQMYKPLSGSTKEEFSYNGEKTALDLEVIDAKATRMNGVLTVKVTNNTSQKIDKAYLRTDLFAKKDIKALVRYIEINDLEPGQSKDYKLKFRAGYVDTYKVAVKEDFPDEDYIFEIFGYEINTKSIFGLDLSKYIDAQAIKQAGFNGITSVFEFFGKIGHRFVVAAQSVPWWGYVGALAIIAGII